MCKGNHSSFRDPTLKNQIAVLGIKASGLLLPGLIKHGAEHSVRLIQKSYVYTSKPKSHIASSLSTAARSILVYSSFYTATIIPIIIPIISTSYTATISIGGPSRTVDSCFIFLNHTMAMVGVT